jgi:hypothetical protein
MGTTKCAGQWWYNCRIEEIMTKNPPPDDDADPTMEHPNFVAQILSQMIPLRTLYGVENADAILSTYSSWRFFKWVPDEENESVDGSKTTDAVTTPQRSQWEGCDKTTTRKCPPMSPTRIVTWAACRGRR